MKAKFLSLLFVLLIAHCATAQVKGRQTTKVEASAKITDLNEYKGHYTSEEDPEGIIISTENNKLVGRIGKQPPIVFEHTGRNTFKSEKAGIVISFPADKKQLALKRKEGIMYLFRK